MRAQNSDDVFYVTYSKWKVWAISIVCWITACIFLFPFFLFTWRELISDIPVFTAIFGPVGLLMAAIPFIHLRRLSKPIAILTRNGVSGMKYRENLSIAWTPNTIIYATYAPRGGYANTVLANPAVTQSRASKLVSGPKDAVIVHHALAIQKRQEVLDAIDRLATYSVKETTHWGSAKH